jgi:hypothetical protein
MKYNYIILISYRVENALRSLKLGYSGKPIYKGPVALKSSDISTARGLLHV